jgi:hypothetical protein
VPEIKSQYWLGRGAATSNEFITSGKNCGEVIEVPTVSGQSVDANHRPRRGHWSPIRERNAVEAAPRQPAHRSGAVGLHLSPFRPVRGYF